MQYYSPAEGSGLVTGVSGLVLGGSVLVNIAPFLTPSPSGLTLELSGFTLLGLRLPGDKEGLLTDRRIDAGGVGDLDFLGLGDF